MTKKLLILIENEGAAAIAESALSWPKRVLGAEVKLYDGLVDTDDLGGYGVVVYCSTLSDRRLPLGCLSWVRERSRLVLWCSEASAPSYQPLLREYQCCFDLMLGTGCGRTDAPNVDEAFMWPCDPQWYAEPVDKTIRCGFGGAVSEPRLRLMDALGSRLAVRPRLPDNDHYLLYARFLAQCRSTVNDAGLDGVLAVKNRCVEAGHAGCLLFENRGSPLREWFAPDVDYVEYGRPEEILERLRAPGFEETAREYGERLRAKVKGPEEFWARVLST